MAARILIAEDEPYIVESLRFLLGREGHSVESVNDGAAVQARLETYKPDLLILDIMLPEMTGFEVLRRVRESEITKALPVLVLSAKGQESDQQRMADLAANDFVMKPFSNRDLINRVTALLPAKTLAGSGQAPAAVEAPMSSDRE
ncbi:MAG: response regulator [Alphaproteobacteria bacterium]|nr:response regulator [Alphaproteobacteria bacterium]